MNKPILAACAGVTFGLFLGGLLMGGFGSRSCHRQVETRAPIRVVESRPQMTTRVVFQSTVIRQHGGVIHTETRQQISNVGPEEALDTLSKAQTAYVTGDYRGAIAIAKTGMGDSPVRANRIIGAAACNLQDLPADRAGLSSARRAESAVRCLCLPAQRCDVFGQPLSLERVAPAARSESELLFQDGSSSTHRK